MKLNPGVTRPAVFWVAVTVTGVVVACRVSTPNTPVKESWGTVTVGGTSSVKGSLLARSTTALLGARTFSETTLEPKSLSPTLGKHW